MLGAAEYKVSRYEVPRFDANMKTLSESDRSLLGETSNIRTVYYVYYEQVLRTKSRIVWAEDVVILKSPDV